MVRSPWSATIGDCDRGNTSRTHPSSACWSRHGRAADWPPVIHAKEQEEQEAEEKDYRRGGE